MEPNKNDNNETNDTNDNNEDSSTKKLLIHFYFIESKKALIMF